MEFVRFTLKKYWNAEYNFEEIKIFNKSDRRCYIGTYLFWLLGFLTAGHYLLSPIIGKNLISLKKYKLCLQGWKIKDR